VRPVPQPEKALTCATPFVTRSLALAGYLIERGYRYAADDVDGVFSFESTAEADAKTWARRIKTSGRCRAKEKRFLPKHVLDRM
jgi:hypothetical protein